MKYIISQHTQNATNPPNNKYFTLQNAAMKYFNFNLKKYDSKILSWNKTKLKQQQKRLGSSFNRKSSVELGALTFSLTFKIRTQSSNHIYSTWDAGLETGSTSEWTRFEGKREDTDKGPWMHQLAGAAAHLHGVLATPVCSLEPFSPNVSLSSLLPNTSAPLDTSLTCATLVHSPLAASQLLPLMLETNTLYKPQAHLWSQPQPQTPASLLFAFILIMENLNTHIPSTTTSNMINMRQPNMAYPQNSQFCYGSWSLTSSTCHLMQACNYNMYSLSVYSATTYHGTKWRIVLPKVRVSTFLFKFCTQICTQLFS